MLPLYALTSAPTEDRFEALYLQYRESVRRTLYWMVGPAAVDDLTQEVFVKVWTRVNQFRGDAALGTWIRRIAINTAYDALRKNRSASSKDAPEPTERDVPLGLTLERAVQSLAPKRRAVFVLFYKEELTEKEISRSLRIPVGTVKSRLHQARTEVQDYLQAQGIEIGRKR